MKPQLIEVGQHNRDLHSASNRIINSGVWKKQRVVMLIPAAESIPTKVYLSHCGLIFPPNQMAHRMAAIGMEVGEAFSQAIEAIITHPELSKWEYILTIEHDNIPPPDGLVKLIKGLEENPKLSCVSGLYWTKGEGGVPQIWGDPNDPILNFRPQPPIQNELVECCGTGMGFALFRMSMFKDEKLKKPWFRTVADKTGIGTQDLNFWGDARKYGYRCAVDCSILVGHYDLATDVVW
jgi:hypothetical protein